MHVALFVQVRETGPYREGDIPQLRLRGDRVVEVATKVALARELGHEIGAAFVGERPMELEDRVVIQLGQGAGLVDDAVGGCRVVETGKAFHRDLPELDRCARRAEPDELSRAPDVPERSLAEHLVEAQAPVL